MADSPNVSSTDLNNGTQPLATTGDTTPLPITTTPNSPEPLYYTTGEARVVRRRRGNAGSSRANPYSNPIANTTTNTRHLAYARRWEWLPTTLNTWRSEEAIRIPADPMDISPYTQEPIHHTVPVLAARLHRHEERLETLERDHHIVENYRLHQTDDRITQLFQEQDNTNHALDMIHQQVIDDRSATDLLQARLEECEQRSQEAEEYARVLEQRLTLAEEGARQTSRLADTINRLVTLMSRVNLRQN